MDIQKLTATYDVRKLKESDIEDVLYVMQKNPLFFQHCPPMATRQSILEDMTALPPNTTDKDKYYIGYYKDDILIAVMDLILNYPNKETAFIGFFMMNKDFQGMGTGTEIFRECCVCLKEAGYRYIRLGFAKGNPQSEAFWLKNGFERTGVEDLQERYTVVVLQKDLYSFPQTASVSHIFKKKLSVEAEKIMIERFGKDTVIALATIEKEIPYVRYVNAYYEDGAFYMITYALSNKMRHIKQIPTVALAGEWFTAHGKAINLGYFGKKENQMVADKLKNAFAEWIDNGHNDFDDENTIILCVELTDGVLLSHGTRYEF